MSASTTERLQEILECLDREKELVAAAYVSAAIDALKRPDCEESLGEAPAFAPDPHPSYRL